MKAVSSADLPAARGRLWRAENGAARCLACGHHCLIREGECGICRMRFNRGGELMVPSGYVAGLNCDPVEKKPFFHVCPGSLAMTFGMVGCNFHCDFCQNWVSSQAFRIPEAGGPVERVTPDRLARIARDHGARLMVASYNEPVIAAEWVADVFAAAKPAGLLCGAVSNGHLTVETLNLWKPWLDVLKVDLKCFDTEKYRTLGGSFETVRETIRETHRRGHWLEVVTLLVPGFNDEEKEIRALARFLSEVDRNIPWHVTAFHSAFRRVGVERTPPLQLLRAAQWGVEEGLRFVYAGNVASQAGEWENTRCPGCRRTLVERRGFSIGRVEVTENGKCPACGEAVRGIWR
ncbi:MAG: AmmeMemoRadiSam system radical SAM enzyme [Verrucomicrobiae bacterium]|nr:AmmeMemoRadiSam system radical SAM enzyme [Verrucomicrobiae bacterium]